MDDILSCLTEFKETDSWAFLELAVAEYIRRPGYHNWGHIEHLGGRLLQCWRDHRVDESIPYWLALAVVYHDLVYEPGSPENEAASARVLMEQFGWFDDVKLAEEAILLTTHSPSAHQKWVASIPAEREATEWFLDADMSILGESSERYESYKKDLRSEYSRFGDKEYSSGRSAFLKGLLDREIFHTAWFRERFDAPARRNIEAELAELRGD